jgi:hypothetical protein
MDRIELETVYGAKVDFPLPYSAREMLIQLWVSRYGVVTESLTPESQARLTREMNVRVNRMLS